jgi:hypothetical protein
MDLAKDVLIPILGLKDTKNFIHGISYLKSYIIFPYIIDKLNKNNIINYVFRWKTKWTTNDNKKFIDCNILQYYLYRSKKIQLIQYNNINNLLRYGAKATFNIDHHYNYTIETYIIKCAKLFSNNDCYVCISKLDYIFNNANSELFEIIINKEYILDSNIFNYLIIGLNKYIERTHNLGLHFYVDNKINEYIKILISLLLREVEFVYTVKIKNSKYQKYVDKLPITINQYEKINTFQIFAMLDKKYILEASELYQAPMIKILEIFTGQTKVIVKLIIEYTGFINEENCYNWIISHIKSKYINYI